MAATNERLEHGRQNLLAKVQSDQSKCVLPAEHDTSILGRGRNKRHFAIEFVGVVHQMGWLASSPEPLTDYKLKLYNADDRLQSLRWSFGIGVNTHWDIYKHCPANGAWREGKQGVHSWQARMLGSINVRSDNIDFHLDWDDPKNIPAYQRFVPVYLNPDIGELRDARGFALSHFAGNEHVLGREEPLAFEAVTDGTAQTIFCGEVAAQFTAWGDPTNLRDPARGVNRTADGFGSPDERGAFFVMLDGSVRFLSRDTDLRVLSALATPDGGEPPP